MRRKFLSVVLCVCMMMTMVPFAFAADDTGSGSSSTSSTTIDFATFVQEVTKAGYNYDGNGITVQWSPASGCYQLGNSNHYKTTQENCVAGSAAVTGNTPTKVNSFLAQYLVFSQAENVVIKNVNFVFAPATFSLCQNAGSVSPTTNKKDDYVGTWDTDHVKSAQLYLTNSGNTTIENCSFDHVVFTSWQNTEKTEIKNSSFKNIYDSYGIKDLGGNGAEVSGCTFENCGGGVMLNSNAARSASTTVSITGNTFKNVDVADTAPEDKAGTRGLIQIAKTGDYADTTFDFSGNTAENCGPAIRQLNASQNSKIAANQLNYLTGVSKLATSDSILFNAVAQVGDNVYESLADAVAAANDGNTVKLLKDVNVGVAETSNFWVKKSIVLDLGGHTITGVYQLALGVNNADAVVTVQNGYLAGGTVSEAYIIAGKLIMDHVTINSNAESCAVQNLGGELELKNCNIDTQVDDADAVRDYTTNHKTVVNNSSISAKGWAVYHNGETGGFVLEATNSTLKSTSAQAVYISGSTQTTAQAGKNQQASFTKCNITGSTGIEGKYTDIVLNDCNVTATAQSPNFEQYNNGSTTDGFAVVSTDNTMTPESPAPTATIKINGGQYAGLIGLSQLVTVEQYPNFKEATYIITAGLFTSDPSNYCADGLTGIPSSEPGYAFTVGQKAATTVKPATGAPDVNVSKSISEEKQGVAKAVGESVTDSTGALSAAANQAIANVTDNQKANAEAAIKAEDSGVTIGTEDIHIYAQTYLAVTPTEYTDTSFTLDIQPMYRVVASTAENAADIVLKEQADTTKTQNAIVLSGSETKLNIQTMEIRLELPDNFVSETSTGSNTYPNVFVQHKGHEYEATVVKNAQGKLVATFINPDGFSSFTISKTSQTVATIGNNSYTSLQAAVDAVKDGETITLTKTCSETATVSRTVKFTLANANQLTGTISASGRHNLTKVDNTTANTTDYTVTYVGGSSSGSGSASTTYNVTVNAATNGTAAADKKTAAKGTTVTITATPSAGYVVDAVKVVDKDGKDVTVTVKNGKYVFTMPGSAVTVTASFKAETPAPSGLPFVDVKSGDWFYDAVKYAYEQGLMTGTSATTFAPNGTMNRAMIVTVLYRLEKSPAVTAPAKFADVPAGQWYSDAVAWAAANNIVNGYNETTFGPMNAVTREQMAAILYRYEQYKGLDTVTLEENLNRFPDQDKVSAYAVPALQWAVGQKIINGNADGTLDPTGTATRAQVAQIFTNLLNQ